MPPAGRQHRWVEQWPAYVQHQALSVMRRSQRLAAVMPLGVDEELRSATRSCSFTFAELTRAGDLVEACRLACVARRCTGGMSKPSRDQHPSAQ